MSQLTVYTIGHSNHMAETFMALLEQHKIRVLVDIRSTPHSQFNPQFNQDALKTAVEAHGMEYRYAGEFLGGRPKTGQPSLTAQTTDESPISPAFDYTGIMRSDHYRRGIKRLLELAALARTAVMCSEGNPLDCHRHHLIARSLVDPLVKFASEDIAVSHIQRNGTLTPAKAEDFNSQLSLF